MKTIVGIIVLSISFNTFANANLQKKKNINNIVQATKAQPSKISPSKPSKIIKYYKPQKVAALSAMPSTETVAIDPTPTNTETTKKKNVNKEPSRNKSFSLTTNRVQKGEVVVQNKDEKKWSLNFSSENMKNMTSDNPAGFDGDIFAVNNLNFGYKIADNINSQIAQEWTQNYGRGTNSKGEANEEIVTLEDTSVRVTRSGVIKSNDLTWAIQGRYYAPTSEVSQAARQVGQLRLYFIGSSEVSKKLSTSVVISPRYYLQRDKDFIDEEGVVGGEKTLGKKVNNNNWRVYNSLGMKYKLSDYFALETTVGVFSKRKFNEDSKHFQDYSTSMYINYEKFGLNLGVRASDGAQDITKEGFELYNHKLSEYFAILSLSI